MNLAPTFGCRYNYGMRKISAYNPWLTVGQTDTLSVCKVVVTPPPWVLVWSTLNSSHCILMDLIYTISRSSLLFYFLFNCSSFSLLFLYKLYQHQNRRLCFASFFKYLFIQLWGFVRQFNPGILKLNAISW